MDTVSMRDGALWTMMANKNNKVSVIRNIKLMHQDFKNAIHIFYCQFVIVANVI